jgi:hypothetical protein
VRRARRGARGLIRPPKLRAGSTHENTLLPATVAELSDAGITLREAAVDAGFIPEQTTNVLRAVGAEVFIVEHQRASDFPGRTWDHRSSTRSPLARYHTALSSASVKGIAPPASAKCRPS